MINSLTFHQLPNTMPLLLLPSASNHKLVSSFSAFETHQSVLYFQSECDPLKKEFTKTKNKRNTHIIVQNTPSSVKYYLLFCKTSRQIWHTLLCFHFLESASCCSESRECLGPLPHSLGMSPCAPTAWGCPLCALVPRPPLRSFNTCSDRASHSSLPVSGVP